MNPRSLLGGAKSYLYFNVSEWMNAEERVVQHKAFQKVQVWVIFSSLSSFHFSFLFTMGKSFFSSSRSNSSSELNGDKSPSVNDVDAMSVKHAEPGTTGQFKEFIKTVISFTGDLSSLTCPAFFLNGLSLLEYG